MARRLMFAPFMPQEIYFADRRSLARQQYALEPGRAGLIVDLNAAIPWVKPREHDSV
jgi:hypothetical protein